MTTIGKRRDGGKKMMPTRCFRGLSLCRRITAAIAFVILPLSSATSTGVGNDRNNDHVDGDYDYDDGMAFPSSSSLLSNDDGYLDDAHRRHRNSKALASSSSSSSSRRRRRRMLDEILPVWSNRIINGVEVSIERLPPPFFCIIFLYI
jgi:hypothetical protein